jgi:DNA excision repair protein ERCC-2
MEQLFRFSKKRPYQSDMVNDIYDAVSRGNDILINAPTGIGKTDASIGAVLSYALHNNKTVFFLTPKISQHRIAIDSLRGIKQKFKLDFRYADIVGKQNMCINEKVNGIEGESFYSACEHLIKNSKCPFFSKVKLFKPEDDADMLDAADLGHNSVFEESYNQGMCAYEVSAKLAKNANVIVAGYSHLLNPYLKQAFLKKISHSLDDSILIWDEAHNVLNAANSYFSVTLSTNGILRAMRELQSIGNMMDLGYLKFALDSLAKKKLEKLDEAFVAKDELPPDILQNANDIISQLENAALEYIEQSKAKRSAIMHIAKFLSEWVHQGQSTASIISRFGNTVKLSLTCLYPERAIPIFGEAYANVFMSATLLPLKMYSDLFGLEDAKLKSYGSPFPSSNKLAIIDADITTKYQERSVEQYKRIAEKIIRIKDSTPGNIAVFFPSFAVLDSTFRYMHDSDIYIQRREMKNVAVESIIKEFQKGNNSMLFGVMGGSLSEGIDYENNSIKGIVIVGIPLTKPDLELSARIEYINRRFSGKGSEYTYTIPAIIRAIQAAGRAVRSENDKAVIVLMDRRYKWSMYKSIVSNSIPISEPIDYIGEIKRFWRMQGAQ